MFRRISSDVSKVKPNGSGSIITTIISDKMKFYFVRFV